ncbi:hypothetical protein DICPUDRAFT_156732 [Dictyostelium purpureum]|uniref:Uncharacterized protein n=1 Tax=Dictyostelium purpureum TaxID=5786 RepID=F0ZXA5_DICPU|nr:uncharacterized protein DICPUDRAFT_156732 [Dictyostelium purpureum]EGC31414.1 hypothetical protein DICPUDRAFT_156732 [Dictyostelium purpureum]|eukprot:XP_003292047.1 hypothetical protein DICPUDRAFT_156732 [Dictyostelium purpureum]
MDWMYLYEQYQGNIGPDDTSFFFNDVRDPQINPGTGDGWFKKGVVKLVSGSGIWTTQSSRSTKSQGVTLDQSANDFLKKIGMDK